MLGCPVHLLTFDQAIDGLQAFIASKEPHLVITADAAGLVSALDDAEHRQIILSADMVTADSVGVLWAIKRSTGQSTRGTGGRE